MANPIILIALVGGALYFLAKKPSAGAAASTSPATPAALPPPEPGSQTVQVPVSLPGVTPENQPQVNVTVPPAYSSPGIAQTAPVGVARFPDAAPATQTPQQQATSVIPNLLAQAAQAATVLAPQAANVLAPPVAVQVEESKLDANGTVELAARLINAESASGWKTALAADVKSWQGRVGLTADGKFGVKSAMKMAEDVGVLPLIRYYPATSSSQAQAVKAYRDQLYTFAANVEQKNPAHALAIQNSAAYETGQGFVTSPKAIPATLRAAQAKVLNAAVASV